MTADAKIFWRLGNMATVETVWSERRQAFVVCCIPHSTIDT